MRVRNNTHYPTDTTRMYNDIPDPMSFVAQSSRRQSYFQRIYFEHLYTKKIGGQTFFYTFTYNNAALPHYDTGQSLHPCFSYDDLRLITNGALSKWLLRNYGSRLVYFCAPESGCGKGSRGFGNNPHYHFLFFIQPFFAKDGTLLETNYKPVSPQALNAYLRRIWLGDDSKFVNYRTAKFGIVQPGENMGLVDDSQRCFSYVGKYVTKDHTTQHEYFVIKKELEQTLKQRGITNHVIYNYYRYCRDVHINVDRSSFIDSFHFYEYQSIKDRLRWSYAYFLEHFYPDEYDLILEYFNSQYVSQALEFELRNYRNKYSGKCRMSKSLGIYGLNFINETNDGTYIKIPALDGYKVQKPSMYYLRKLYYNVFSCPVTGNVLYRLNERGLNRSCCLLPRLLDGVVSNTISNISYVQINKLQILSNEPEYNSQGEFISYEYNKTSVWKKIMAIPNDESIFWKYAVYTMVYKHRYINKSMPIRLSSSFDLNDIVSDYRYFSANYLDLADYYEFNRHYFRKDGYTSFSYHPLFKDLLKWFSLFDLVNDKVSAIVSDIKTFKFEAGLYRKKAITASLY